MTTGADHYENYHNLWISSFWRPSLDLDIMNDRAAQNLIEIIKLLISEQK